MKNSFKKIISLVLTVLMLVGTVSALVPFMVSAEDSYTTITPNTDFTHNDVTYRFDVVDGHSDSVAKIYADGSIEVTLKNGDMLWLPDVSLKSDSEIHAEVTNLSNNCEGFFAAFAYGVIDQGSTWTEGMFATVKDGGRLRVNTATYSTLAGNNGADIKLFDHAGSTIKSTDTAWKAVVNSNNAWTKDATIAFDISKSGDNVTVDFAHPTLGSFGYAYTYDTTSNSTYYFEGGSVGFTSTYATAYKTFRINEIEVDDFRIGVSEESAEPEAPEGTVYLEKNKTATYKGITYRFDTNKENDANSWVRVNADGSWEISIRNGDMLWFPDIELTSSSEIYAEVTNVMTRPNNYFTGFAYGVTSSTNSTYTDTNVAVLRTVDNNNRMRFRATNATGAKLIGVSGSDYGNGGDTRAFNNDFERSAVYDTIAGENGNWGPDKTVYYKVSQSGSDVVLEYGAPGAGAFIDVSNTTYTASKLNAIAGGSVGYTHVWQDNDTDHIQLRIENIIVTNCKVGNTDKASYSVKAIESKVENVVRNLSLDGTIGLNFAFDATNLMNATVVATKNGSVVAEQAVVEGANIMTVPVAAKEMGDNINFSIMADGVLYSEHSYTTSVAEYAAALKGDAEWTALMDAMLKYGAAAQMLLGYKTDALVTTDSIADYDFSSMPSIVISGDKSILKALSMNLALESDTTLRLYFMTADGSVPTVTVDGEVAELTDNGDGFYMLSISGIAADKLCDDFAIVVNGTLSFAVNALDWAKIASEDDDANVATLADALAAYADEAAKKKSAPIINLDGRIATAADIAALRATTDERINAIKNTSSIPLSTTWNKKVYYVSSSEGSDSNNGTSPSTPFKTIAKVNSTLESLSSLYSATVCFKRGDTWRGEQLVAIENLTVTAYGTGDKPVIMASPENGGGSANASKWTDMGNNIWRYEGSQDWDDVGNIIFDDGASFAKKITQLYVMNEGDTNYRITDFTNAPAQTYTFTSYTDLKNDLDFFHDKDFVGGSGATGYLYMDSTSNPATRFNSIEFATNLKLVYIHHDNGVTVDNICFKYTGAHAIAADGQPDATLSDLTVQNCEFYWIGGSIQDRIAQSVIGQEAVVYDVRYGNAIEVYGQVDGFVATNNYIYQVFDAGITVQKTMSTDSTEDWSQKNIEFTDNVIEYCNYSIEYFLTKIPEGNDSSMVNFVISGNYMWNAGYGFCETRPIWGRGFAAHTKCQFTSPCNKATGFEITDNVMIETRDNFLQIRNSYGTDSMPLFENNTLYGYYDYDGTAANGFRIGEVRVASDNEQIWASYDSNIDAYLETNMGSKYGEGNKYYFIF